MSDRVNRKHTNVDVQPSVRISCAANCGSVVEANLPASEHWRDESAWARLELEAFAQWNAKNRDGS